MYYAHTSGETDEWHKLADHLRAVAERARSFAEPFGAGEVAYWVGLLHDLGKFSPGFQSYLEEADSARRENRLGPTRGPDHSSVGWWWLALPTAKTIHNLDRQHKVERSLGQLPARRAGFISITNRR